MWQNRKKKKMQCFSRSFVFIVYSLSELSVRKHLFINPFPHVYINLQQTTLNIFCQKMVISDWNWMDNQWLIMSNFIFCHNVFRSRLLQRRQKASIILYMRERVKQHVLIKLKRSYKRCWNTQLLFLNTKLLWIHGGNIQLTLSLIRQFCSRRLWTYFVKT